jgi:hypothetical protein
MLTNEESAALMQDITFRGRVKVSSLRYADSIMNEANTVAAHNTRLRWAQNTFQQPDMVAGQLQSPVVMDAAVQEAGAAITDVALQGSVEAVVNKML